MPDWLIITIGGGGVCLLLIFFACLYNKFRKRTVQKYPTNGPEDFSGEYDSELEMPRGSIKNEHEFVKNDSTLNESIK